MAVTVCPYRDSSLGAQAVVKWANRAVMAASTSAANVCVLLPPVIDVQSFSLWLSGLSPQVAAERIIKIDFEDQFHSVDSETTQLYKEETVDRFRNYTLLENSLKTPRLLRRNRYLPSSTFFEAQKIDLVSKYYSFDSRVFRHFLGRKLTNKFQKDLDDVRDEVGVPLRSVRRQFGNLRRIFDFYDDVGDSVMVTTQTLLEIEFLLPEHLSRAYSCALFLLVHRFQLQISKKKYQLLTWEDCCFVAEQIMLHWLQRPAFNSKSAEKDRVEYSKARPRWPQRKERQRRNWSAYFIPRDFQPCK